MYYRSIFFLIQVVLLSTIIIYDGNLASAADYCSDPVGTLVSIQGDAQSRQAGKTRWQPVQLNDRFCAGDILKVGAGGRAAVTLDNETVIRVDQNSTLNFRSEKGKVSLLDLVNGVLHIFSHRPRSLKVITPYVNGIVEGTEFLVNADDRQSVITVFEGHVRAENARGALELSSGQSASATAQTAPSYAAVIAPRDAVQWTLYYPSLLDPTLPGVDPEATGFLRTVDDYLTTGRVAEAKRILTEVLKDDQQNSEALAFLSIIAVVQNNKEDARELAQRAFDLSPGSAVAGLALSYTEQADFKIERALRILQETAGKNPGDAQVLTRLAELQLSVGELEKALDTALEAVKLSSNIGRVHAVLGFVQLAGMETEKAESSFRQAIVLDQALPLARLGMGLAYIRNGDLIAGRAEIEIAAALDPGNSMIRSYLGKAYYEEKRDGQSHRQYLIARELDPADPTPWFYDAIRKQTVNRPVEALYDLQKSIELNDNRAVFRSRFLLDDDLAARSSSLGRLFHDLGFQRLALTEGWKSVSANPGNFSAHRFLADSYRILPRHEIAQVSELLQAQLLQPINISPVQPQLAESNLTILDGAGPGRASYNEYNPLFLRNRLALQVSGIAGSNDSLGDELIHSAVWDNLSYSLGQYYYRTDGIRENNDTENTIYNVYLQGMLSPRTSLMSEFRFKDSTFGDTLFSFEPTDFSPTIRQSDEEKSLRVGIRHDFQPHSTLLATAILSTSDNSAGGIEEFGVSVDIANTTDSTMAEIQHVYTGRRVNLQSGSGYISSDETSSVSLGVPIGSLIEEDSTTEHATIYSYAQIDLSHQLTATLGLGGDLLDSPVKDREQVNPKLGISWQPVKSTLLRGAVFRTLQRRLVYAQTIEPTHVAGFNQFFDDFPATSAWTYAAGIDHSFKDNVFAGLQFFHRDLDVPFTWVADPTGVPVQVEDEWQEDVGSAYLYWAPATWFTAGLEYYYEQFTHDQWEGPQEIKSLTTHRLTPKIHFFHPSGISSRIQAHYVDQTGDFGSTFTGFSRDTEQFWIVDLEFTYRLPKRFGTLGLGVKNLFDEGFRFLDTDPANPRFLSEQQLFLSLTIAL